MVVPLDHIRADNESGSIIETVRDFLRNISVKTLDIESGWPWGTSYNEVADGELWGELLNEGIFDTLIEVKVLVEQWRTQYNTRRPHSVLAC